jgi:hypothetical protein
MQPVLPQADDQVLTIQSGITEGYQHDRIGGSNAALFRLAGERDPYKSARLGELTVGARADVLLIDGDPTTDLTLLADPSRNIALIVKDGAVVKNTLPTTLYESGGR